MSHAGDYGTHEYEVTAAVRVYADDPDAAFEAGVTIILGCIREEAVSVNVRLINEDEEGSCRS